MQPLSIPSWFRHARKLAEAEWRQTHNYERRAVFLSDPKALSMIDARIRFTIWPIITRFFKSSRFELANGSEPNIQTEWKIHPCREFSFMFADPKRNSRSENPPPWHVSGKVECSSRSTMISLRSTITLPNNCDFALILDLLSEASLDAELRISSMPTRQSFYEIGFNHCFGRPNFEDVLPKLLSGMADFIETACEIEETPNEPILFRRLINEVRILESF